MRIKRIASLFLAAVLVLLLVPVAGMCASADAPDAVLDLSVQANCTQLGGALGGGYDADEQALRVEGDGGNEYMLDVSGFGLRAADCAYVVFYGKITGGGLSVGFYNAVAATEGGWAPVTLTSEYAPAIGSINMLAGDETAQVNVLVLNPQNPAGSTLHLKSVAFFNNQQDALDYAATLNTGGEEEYPGLPQPEWIVDFTRDNWNSRVSELTGYNSYGGHSLGQLAYNVTTTAPFSSGEGDWRGQRSVYYLNLGGMLRMPRCGYAVIYMKRLNSLASMNDRQMRVELQNASWSQAIMADVTLNVANDEYQAYVVPFTGQGTDLAAYLMLWPTADYVDALGGTELFVKYVAIFDNQQDAQDFANGYTPAEGDGDGDYEYQYWDPDNWSLGAEYDDLALNLYGGAGDPVPVKDGIPLQTTTALAQAMNMKFWRLGMHAAGCMGLPGPDDADPFIINPAEREEVNGNGVTGHILDTHRTIAALRDAGVDLVIGTTSAWLVPTEAWPYVAMAEYEQTPAYDPTPGSAYMKFLEYYRLMWKLWAAEFPEIRYWQVGNETNYINGGVDAAKITADLCYYATLGVRDAGTGALVITPGVAPIGGFLNGAVARFLEEVYAYIASSNGPDGCTEPDDYFQALAWHTYTFGAPMREAWVRENILAYEVAIKYGQGDIPVFITEFGYTDNGDAGLDAQQGPYMLEGIENIRQHLPFVKALAVFRLYNEHALSQPPVSNIGEANFGLFTDPDEDNGYITPKAKAIGVCQAYGGDPEAIWQFARPSATPADKAGLRLAIGEAKNLAASEALYTPESFLAFSSAYNRALAVESDPDATQAQVDEARSSLKSSMAGLKKKPQPSPEPGPGDSETTPPAGQPTPATTAAGGAVPPTGRGGAGSTATAPTQSEPSREPSSSTKPADNSAQVPDTPQTDDAPESRPEAQQDLSVPLAESPQAETGGVLWVMIAVAAGVALAALAVLLVARHRRRRNG